MATYNVTLKDASNNVGFPLTTVDQVQLSDGTRLNTILDSGRWTNPNLLDNPWFTINQRGLTSITDGTYAVDRWKGTYAVNNTTHVITIASTAYAFLQPIEDAFKSSIAGKNVTASVLYSDGTIESGSTNWGDASSVATAFDKTRGKVTLDPTYGLVFWPKVSNVQLKAIKLELGSVSTLANDTAPNYATELLKCQRYFYRANNYFEAAYCNSVYVYAPITVATEMRATPNAIVNGTGFVTVNNITATPTSISIIAMASNRVYFEIKGSFGSSRNPATWHDIYIDLTADL